MILLFAGLLGMSRVVMFFPGFVGMAGMVLFRNRLIGLMSVVMPVNKKNPPQISSDAEDNQGDDQPVGTAQGNPHHLTPPPANRQSSARARR
jgi:hypothetical protein